MTSTVFSPPSDGEQIGGSAHDVTILTAGDDVELALHRWTRPGNQAVLFYIHGIQSHAGWLFETGPWLADGGVDVYALDRRGSGRSGGPRGHLRSAWQVLDDYERALGQVAAVAARRPLVALGQSLGGSVLAALWATSRLPTLRRLVFCAPALGQQRRRHSPEALRELRNSAGEQRRPLSLDDADYTSMTRYSAFMANDHLMLRQVTASTLATLVELEDCYMTGAHPDPLPVALVRAVRDPIIDLDAAEAVLRSLSTFPIDMRQFDIDRHYIEFSEARTAYWDWLITLVTAEADRPEPTS
ncbi:alpha/beta fold hydrolase [Actinoallomurus sp. NPDC052274]|uniref:alpha/beta fold hydrolase n=1 Tax=Actinoallomurus sp. NPDC052274 TaxID=3155420 RepID=UPI0034181D51